MDAFHIYFALHRHLRDILNESISFYTLLVYIDSFTAHSPALASVISMADIPTSNATRARTPGFESAEQESSRRLHQTLNDAAKKAILENHATLRNDRKITDEDWKLMIDAVTELVRGGALTDYTFKRARNFYNELLRSKSKREKRRGAELQKLVQETGSDMDNGPSGVRPSIES
jgi:hypothetical protein